MKYYSDLTRKFYESAEDCSAAEDEFYKAKEAKETKEKALKEERKNRANEVSEAYKAYLSAKNNYYKLLKNFVSDYGSYHMTYTGDDANNLLDFPFFKFFPWD